MLLALRDEERSRPARAGSITTNRDDVAEGVDATCGMMRRGARLALRHRRARLQGEPLRRPRGDRALPARQGRAPPRAAAARRSQLYDAAVAELDGIEPVARDPRDTHALHLYVVRIDAERPARRATTYQRGARRGEHRHEHPLPAGAPADGVPRALPRAGAAAGRRARRARGALAAALAGALRARTSRTRSTHSAACTRRFARVRRRRLDPRRGDARRHRPLRRVHHLEDRRRQDARHPPRRRPRLLLRLGRDHGRHRPADGLALAAAARRRAGSTTGSAG